MFFKKGKHSTSSIEWMVVGLGNPGKKYDNTRHNVGFAAVDYAAEQWNISVRQAKFDALCGTGMVEEQKILLMKPQTFMNLSGVSVQQAADYYGIPPEKIMVWMDDISLEPGFLRVRMSGSAGGHNGLKSIIAAVGDTFPRVKIGVGAKPHPDYDLASWVLSKFTQNEQIAIQNRFADIASATVLVMQGEVSKAMALYNGEGKK